ncbi:MAG: glycosyltransferase family 2 protein [Deltaproteobacteria bacterium]|nr:glycosyltransferase family 2 protein [Deltaproteobacteria bacterium]
MHTISIIIPAYNEEHSIGRIVKKIRDLYADSEIIVVDDGSTDNTADKARQAGAQVHSHPYNIGNGAAVKTGIRASRGQYLVFMDGDGQHDPNDIGKMLSCLSEFDMVVGERTLKGQSSWLRALGNTFYNRLASYVAKFKIKDLTSGFRAVKADIAREFLYLLPNTYSYPTTITLGVLRTGRSIKYIPASVGPRRKGKSNIHIFKDGINFFMVILKICTLYSPLRVFLPASFSVFLLGLCYYGYTLISWGRFTNMSMLLFTTSVLIFMMGLISEQICQMRFEKTL